MKIKTDGLFLLNNHSRFNIGWKKVEEKVEKEIHGIVSRHYSYLGDVLNIKQVDEWEKQSNNFRVTFSSGEEILLRKFIKLREAEKIKLLNSIIFFLKSNSAPVSLPVSTDGNKIFFFEGEFFYEAFEFVPGNHFSGEKDELREVAKGLAFFHRAIALFPSKEKLPNPKVFLFRDKKVWEDIFSLARQKNTARDHLLLDHKIFILNIVSLIQKHYEVGVLVDNTQPIHCDIHPLNFILNEGKLQAILDFDGVRIGELLRDIGNAMYRLVRQYVVFHQGQRLVEYLIGEGAGVFLSEYLRCNSINENLSSMPIYIYDELLRKIYSGLSPYYYDGVDRYEYMIDGPDAQLPKMFNLLKEVEVIAYCLSH